MINTRSVLAIGVFGMAVACGVGSSELRAGLLGSLKQVAGTPAPAVPTTLPSAAASQAKGSVDGVLSKAQNVASSTTAPTTMPTTMPADLSAQARAGIEQAIAYIKSNKLELAEKTLGALEQQKASLPVSLQGQLVQLRSMLDSAKAGASSGFALPKL